MKLRTTTPLALALAIFAAAASAQTPAPTPADDAASPGRFVVSGQLGYGFGSSLGGDYERCEGNTTCSERKKPATQMYSLHAGYELPAGVEFGVDLGSISGIDMEVRRKTTLLGEQSVPVPVDIKDVVQAKGSVLGVSASYTYLRKPIVGAFGIGVGQWYSTLSTRRTGTAAVDGDPARRLSANEDVEPVETTITVFMPELRFGYAFHKHFEAGLSLGAFLAVGSEVRPKVAQTPASTSTDPQPKVGGKAVGFVPQPNATPETAMAEFVLFRSSLYVRVPF